MSLIDKLKMAEHLKVGVDSDEEFDDWMIQSINSYKNLHMFELQQATRVIEWISDKAIYVAGCEDGVRNEILELTAPEKLLATSENEGLSKERDFKLRSGGFSDRPVYSLKYLPQTRLIITSGPPDSSAQIWTLSRDDSDVIKVMKTVCPDNGSPHFCYLDTHRDLTDTFLMGSTFHDIQVVDVSTGKPKFCSNNDSRERICGLKFVDSNVCITCSGESEEICTIDFRMCPSSQSQSSFSQADQSHGRKECQSEVKGADQSQNSCEHDRKSQSSGQKLLHDLTEPPHQILPSDERKVKCLSFDICNKMNSNREEDTAKRMKLESDNMQIYRLTSNKEILINDLRNINEPVTKMKLEIPGPTDETNTHLKICPSHPNIISVSGFDNKVYIYDIKKIHQEASDQAKSLQPLFIHEGHMSGGSTNQNTVVLEHTWHPWKEHLLMSSGSDGSLHAWEFVV
ncbi:WD repeat-containing protein 73-like [Ptychodera flava]|uniref:WD repeat-containing protein 73-like n=1 Tax=Ptychodera flava TaxID=63121 RepID=UPI00396A357E